MCVCRTQKLWKWQVSSRFPRYRICLMGRSSCCDTVIKEMARPKDRTPRPPHPPWANHTHTRTHTTPRQKEDMFTVTAPKGYVSLVDHALAQSEVGVRQVGQSLQQNLWRHLSLEVGRVELVPTDTREIQSDVQRVLTRTFHHVH